jgi:hypothetical protein
MKSILVTHRGIWVAACLLATASFVACSDDSTAPVVTNPPPGNTTVEPPTLTFENVVPPPVRIAGMACWDNGTSVVCSELGFVARFQNNAWEVLKTGRAANFNAVWGTSVDDFYVVGDSGCILHFDGSSFTSVEVGLLQDFVDVWGTSARDVWFCGRTSIVYWDGSKATVHGSSSLPLGGTVSGIGGNKRTDVWAVGSSGHVFHWDGTSWSDAAPGLGTENLNCVYVTGSDVFIGGNDGELWHFNGTKWSAFQATSAGPQDDVNVIVGTAPNKVWAFGFDRLMWHWDGTAWSDLSDPFFDTTFDFYAASAAGTTVMAGGYYRSGSTNMARRQGATWTPATTIGASDANLRSAWTFNRNHAFAFGEMGTILQRDANGWSVVPHGLTTETLRGAWASSSTNLYVVGENASVLHYDGAVWTIVAAGPAVLYDISGSSPDNVWAVGPGALWHWDGFAWLDRASEIPDPTASYDAVYVAPGGDVFLAGENLLRFDGTTWTNYSIKVGSSSPYVEDMWGASASNIWLGAYDGVLQFDGTKVEMRWPSGTGDSYAVTGRDDDVLAAHVTDLVEFPSGTPVAYPLASGFTITGAHMGGDGVAYVVGSYGYIVRVE